MKGNKEPYSKSIDRINNVINKNNPTDIKRNFTFKSLDDFKFDFEFDESLLNPSKTFKDEDELKLTQKKTAKDFFSSSSSEDENIKNSNIYKKSKKDKKTEKAKKREKSEKTKISLNQKKNYDISSISDFSSDNEKKINLIEIYDQNKYCNKKRDKLDKYKLKNKFLLEDYKKYKESEDLNTFYKKIQEIKEYSGEDIIKKFNKISSEKKRRKFLEKFEYKETIFDKINIRFTVDLNSDKDLFHYGALQIKDVPIFKRITKNKIIGIKNEKVCKEILKDLNEMTGQYDKALDEDLKKNNKNKSNLRYFKKNAYTKVLIEETNNSNFIRKIESMSINSKLEKKKEKFKMDLNKKIEENINNTEQDRIYNKISQGIQNSLDDVALIENSNFEILFEKYNKNLFDSSEYLNNHLKKIYTEKNHNSCNDNNIEMNQFDRLFARECTNILSKDFIPFNSIKHNKNLEEEKFFSVFNNFFDFKNIKKDEEDPLSLAIDFSQICQNDKNFLLKNSEYNKKLNEDPENIILWIEYINYQDELFVTNSNMFKNEKNKLEVKINIIEKALKIEKNRKNYILNILRLRILNKLNSDNFNQVNLYWMIAFDSFYLEKSFLNEYLITLKKQPHLTISDIKDYYLALIKFYEMKLQREDKDKKAIIKKISKFIVDVIFDLISIDKNAGYYQRSFHILRCLLELKILEFKNIINAKNLNSIKEYEEYFESGFPKIGDFENSKGYLDYKEFKIKVNKDLLNKEDFIDNNPLLRILRENKSYKLMKLDNYLLNRIFNSEDKKDLFEDENLSNFIDEQITDNSQNIINYRPLNPILDYEKIEQDPESFLFYSDVKDFVEIKIKLNSEILIYIISKVISYLVGFEIDNEICFNCKENFIFKNKANEVYNNIFFAKYYLIDIEQSKLLDNFQLLIYMIRFFQYLEMMNIDMKELKFLEMDFIFMINHPNLKDNILSKIHPEKTIIFPFTDINQYAKSIFKLRDNQNDIDLDFSLNGTLSYHFYMSFFVNYHLTDEIFFKLNEFLKVNKKFKQIVSFNVTDPNDDGLWFNILIQKETDYEYARKLTHLYLKQLKPFLDLNKNVIKQMPEPFSRLFFINGENAYKFCGKTVHNTQISDWVTTHYPGEINYKYTVWIKYEYGYISHFRKSLKHNMHEKNISISDFNFDFNYFSCYFKHIAKQLNYKLVY